MVRGGVQWGEVLGLGVEWDEREGGWGEGDDVVMWEDGVCGDDGVWGEDGVMMG